MKVFYVKALAQRPLVTVDTVIADDREEAEKQFLQKRAQYIEICNARGLDWHTLELNSPEQDTNDGGWLFS